MGRELAGATARWDALLDHPAARDRGRGRPRCRRLRVVRPTTPWSRSSPTDYRQLLDDPDVDVVYLAVPHDLHERLYLDMVAPARTSSARSRSASTRRGQRRIVAEAESRPAVRARARASCRSSPARSGPSTGPGGRARARILEVRGSFLHSSDLDPRKPINWKRSALLRRVGVHRRPRHARRAPAAAPRLAAATPLRLLPTRDAASRPDGEPSPCDTWDNASLLCEAERGGFPMLLETKRIAPGQSNTWYFETLGRTAACLLDPQPAVLRGSATLGGRRRGRRPTARPPRRYGRPSPAGIFEFGSPTAPADVGRVPGRARRHCWVTGSARRPRTRPSPRTVCSQPPFDRTRQGSAVAL